MFVRLLPNKLKSGCKKKNAPGCTTASKYKKKKGNEEIKEE